MENTYSMTIAGLKRDLKLCAIDNTIDIAAFIIFGDVELTVAASEALLGRAPEFDVIMTPEAKSIPLAYEMARQSGKSYVVARKSKKLYMTNPVGVEVQSITTSKLQNLYIGEEEAEKLRGKRVLVVDDVISTGDSLNAVEKLVNEAGGEIVASCAILAEGDAAKRDDIIFLEPLPLFFKV
ncbi:MAG TPA: adenine phosphoribosyltransferase [Ruminococcaceae bacterium]|nr:adenine phosphoribosyltransferase [Oscillospiraceae bacterium]